MTTAEKLVQVLTERKMTCATAESCTGGGVGCAITSVPGSSAVFWGGVISYDNSVKQGVLGVPEEVAMQDACKMEHDISDETWKAIKKHWDDKK